MLVILFRSRLTEEAGDDYQDMAAEMRAYAKTHRGYDPARFEVGSTPP